MTGSIVVSMSPEDIQAIAATVVKQLQGVRFTSPTPPASSECVEQLLLKDTDVATMLGISKPHVWNCARDGRLPKPYKFGTGTFWKKDEILRVIDVLEQTP